MSPDNIQNQPGTPTHLPPVQDGQPQPSAPLPHSSVAQAPGIAATARYVTQTKQLAIRYSNSPFQLSAAVDQLKAAYLAEQYHVTPNQTGM